MVKAKQFLGKYGIHSFLLPVFFVLHNYMQYSGLVSAPVAWQVLGEIAGIVLLFFLLMLWRTKNRDKSLQLTTFTFFVILFFGVAKDFAEITLGLHFITKYIIFLPLVVIISVVVYRQIIKKRNFFKINLFENILLLVFIFSDILLLLFSQNKVFFHQNLLVKKDLLNIQQMAVPAEKPDVYYLLFDCYPGQKFLQGYMQYDNHALDSALENRGFRVISNPKSNYNRTAFSMASVLNFEYLKNINNNTILLSKHYTHAQFTIKTASVPAVFEHLGYKIYNLSIFELGGQQPIHKESFLTLPERRVLLFNTLSERLRNDIFWNFITGNFSNAFFRRMNEPRQSDIFEAEMKKKAFNQLVADSVQALPRHTEKTPRFVYAHLYLPHPPFFYKENGEANDPVLAIDPNSQTDKELFLSYLRYTNKVMLKLVDSIQHKPGKPPVIIVQSDHGFRDFKGGPSVPYLYFKNYMAFYFPDGNYSGLYDTMSNVNTFPVLFNKYFGTHIPMQKDTSTFLPY